MSAVIRKGDGESWYSVHRRTRRYKRATALAYAYPELELKQIVRDLYSIIASIPEADRAAVYEGMGRLTRADQEPGDAYAWGPGAGAAIRLMNTVWPSWPRQSEEGP